MAYTSRKEFASFALILLREWWSCGTGYFFVTQPKDICHSLLGADKPGEAMFLVRRLLVALELFGQARRFVPASIPTKTIVEVFLSICECFQSDLIYSCKIYHIYKTCFLHHDCNSLSPVKQYMGLCKDSICTFVFQCTSYFICLINYIYSSLFPILHTHILVRITTESNLFMPSFSSG